MNYQWKGIASVLLEVHVEGGNEIPCQVMTRKTLEPTRRPVQVECFARASTKVSPHLALLLSAMGLSSQQIDLPRMSRDKLA